MKKNLNKNLRNSYIVLFFLVFSFICIDNDMLSAATIEDKKWSFEFSGVSLSEVVNKLGNVSGIEIFIIGDMDARSITKSYNNSPIESILLDVFKGENHAVLFQYDAAGLTAINIWVLPEGEEGDIMRNYIYADPVIPIATENYRKTPEYLTRSRTNNIPNRTNNNSNSKNVGKRNNPFVSFKKADSTSPTDNIQENDPSEKTFSDPETVDVIPLPEIVTTLGLEPPPMPPGLSFSN